VPRSEWRSHTASRSRWRDQHREHRGRSPSGARARQRHRPSHPVLGVPRRSDGGRRNHASGSEWAASPRRVRPHRHPRFCFAILGSKHAHVHRCFLSRKHPSCRGEPLTTSLDPCRWIPAQVRLVPRLPAARKPPTAYGLRSLPLPRRLGQRCDFESTVAHQWLVGGRHHRPAVAAQDGWKSVRG
jgi:hypothetical protein